MKKVLSFITVLLIVLSLAACGDGQSAGKEITDLHGADAPSAAATQSTQAATEPAPETTAPVATEEKKDTGSIDPDFKATMDSYEKFFDEYVAIMKKYKENPTDLSILSDYANYMGQYTDMMQKLEKWEDEDLNAAELAYYVDVQARIAKKLLEVA